MILLSEEVRAWGHVVTVHYSHPERATVAQIALATRADFTELDPANPIIRAAAFFTSCVDGGEEVELTGPPHHAPAQLRAERLTELRAQLIADNCGARALVSQFGWQGTPAPLAEARATHVVTFQNPGNGTVAFRHLAKTFGSGRAIGEAEAVARAQADAIRFGIDLAGVEMVVSAEL